MLPVLMQKNKRPCFLEKMVKASTLLLTVAFAYIIMSGISPMSRVRAASHNEPFHTIMIDAESEDPNSFYLTSKKVVIEADRFVVYDDVNDDVPNANIIWDKDTATLTLNNCNLTFNGNKAAYGPIFNVCGVENFTLVIKGDNVLNRTGLEAGKTTDDPPAIKFGKMSGVLTFTGDGTLNVTSDGGKAAIFFENYGLPEEQRYIKFKNTAEITASSPNAIRTEWDSDDVDVLLPGTKLRLVSNSGHINGRIQLDWYRFTNMVPYTTEYSEQVQHDFVAKAYYFQNTELPVNNLAAAWTADFLAIPNQICQKLDYDLVPRRAIGRYDDEGYPIVSDGYWQWFYITDEEWGSSREEENKPTVHLLYGEPEELDALITPVDKLQIDDGKKHVINTDLRNLSVSCGDVTINGNIRYGLHLTSGLIWDGPPSEDGLINFIRDINGVPVTVVDSSGCDVTLNGNVMSFELSDTFKGDVTINGSSMFTSYDYELLSEDGSPVDGVGFPSDLYAAVINPGKIVKKGKFVGDMKPFEGWIQGAEYEGENYTNLSHEEEGEFVHGTQTIVNDSVLTVDLTAEGIKEDAFPFVKEAGEEEVKKAKELLGDDHAKVLALSISIISGGDKVQPDKAVNLYLSGITGFTNPTLYHIKDDGTIEKVFEFSGSSFDGRIKAPVNSFSTYFVSESTSVVMYRLYNPNSGEHFYTASTKERDSLKKQGWEYEGKGWDAPKEGDPVYRLYNPNAGDHHYTMSEKEKDKLVKAGWSYEGIGWRSADKETGKPVYRLYNPNAISGAHHYTMSKRESDRLVTLGWKFEGVGWYSY